MTDNLAKTQRSYCMSKIRSKNTIPEILYRKKYKNLVYQPNTFGKPDFIDYKTKTAIFIDGCFWHCCPKHFIDPKSNKEYWSKKIKKNILRDAEINLCYKSSGY